MSRFFNERLHMLEPYTPGEQPKDMARLIKLNTNENPFPPGDKVRQVLAQTCGEDLRLYPDPMATELCAAAAKAWGLDSRQVLAGNGSDEILAFCFQAFAGDGISFPEISYGFYKVWAQLYGVEACRVPLRDGLSLCVDDYMGTKNAVLIANPNAPTGQAVASEDIRRLLEADKNRLVMVDEAYADFAEENALPLLAEYDNLLIIRTLSKGYSLAGARIGFALGAPELIEDLNRVKFSFNPYNLDRLSIKIGAAALGDQEYFSACRDKVLEQRYWLTQELKALGFKAENSSANFIFVGEHPRLKAAEWFRLLREQGIVTRYFPVAPIDNRLRISMGMQEDNEALLEATKEILMSGR